MAFNDNILDHSQGLTFSTPGDARAYLAEIKNQRIWDTRTENRLEATIARWETHLGNSHVERLKGRSETIAEIRESAKDTMDVGQRRAVEIAHDLKTGRLDYSSGLRDLAKLRAQHQETLRILDSLTKSSEAWEEDADRPVDDIAAEMQTRFPSAGVGGLTVTVAMLKGDAPDPFIK